MSQFKNVTVVKEANIYFDGKVTSRTVVFEDGTRRTLGIMLPGEYEFSTHDPEYMEIFSGRMEVLFPCAKEWKPFAAGESFDIQAGVKFQIKVPVVTDYCCSYGA